MAYKRFHVIVKKGRGTRRTTISIEDYIADYMAIKLGHAPDTPEAHSAVREWIQAEQDEQNASYSVANIIKGHMFEEIVDKNLSKKYWAWRLKKG